MSDLQHLFHINIFMTCLGVVGRGNFGIVHRATLKRAGEEKFVAVKSLAGSYSPHISAFRCYFTLVLKLLGLQ